MDKELNYLYYYLHSTQNTDNEIETPARGEVKIWKGRCSQDNLLAGKGTEEAADGVPVGTEDSTTSGLIGFSLEATARKMEAGVGAGSQTGGRRRMRTSMDYPRTVTIQSTHNFSRPPVGASRMLQNSSTSTDARLYIWPGGKARPSPRTVSS